MYFVRHVYLQECSSRVFYLLDVQMDINSNYSDRSRWFTAGTILKFEQKCCKARFFWDIVGSQLYEKHRTTRAKIICRGIILNSLSYL